MRLSMFTCNTTLFGCDFIYDCMAMDGTRVRKWRDRGFFTGGEKAGRQYLYTVKDIAKLMIMRELDDVGFKLFTAATAADKGAVDLIAHAFLRAPLLEIIAKPQDDVDFIIYRARTSIPGCPSTLTTLFYPEADVTMEWQEPYNYLITGGDDIDHWTMINDLDEIDEELADFNLAVTFIDLRKLADRLIEVLKKAEAGRVVTFETQDCYKQKQPRIIHFSTDPNVEPIGVS
jgi:DNA-binding transcriptional MerR regulator